MAISQTPGPRPLSFLRKNSPINSPGPCLREEKSSLELMDKESWRNKPDQRTMVRLERRRKVAEYRTLGNLEERELLGESMSFPLHCWGSKHFFPLLLSQMEDYLGFSLMTWRVMGWFSANSQIKKSEDFWVAKSLSCLMISHFHVL